MPKIDWISIFFEEKSSKNRNWLTTPYMGGYKPENCSGRLPVPLSTIEHTPLARHTVQALEEIRMIVGTTAIEGAFKAIYGVMGIAMAVGLPFAVIGMKERRPGLLLPIILFNASLLQAFAILSVCFALFYSGITTGNIFVIPSLMMTAVAVCYYLHSMRVFMRIHEDFWEEEEEMEDELDKILEEQMKGMVERKEALVGS
ncbi:hypothetical protein PRIPAC_72995, partial [Pristionchus pacificus]|uniref:Uncharacterized protein n=1 Tax=Pristionchus pacificus TaxID=54126 RepID=A0A2A6CFQ2_PRIPA